MSHQEPKLLESKTVFTSRKFSVREEKFALPTGEEVPRATVVHPGAAVMLPQLPDGRLVLVEQFRFPLRANHLEFPAGTRDPGESAEATAVRELKEEIGGESSDWIRLGSGYSAPGFTDELLEIFLARNVVLGEANPDPGEQLTFHYMTPSEIEAAIRSGKLNDMKSVVGFYLARLAAVL